MISLLQNVNQIRNHFAKLKPDERGMLEIVNCTFVADEPAIFGTPNEDWHRRELAWYLSQSRNVNDIPPPIPEIWKQVSSRSGMINSNYGWAIFSDENHEQFDACIRTLVKDPYSRQAVMIYTRPTMHKDFNADGMYDFICTNTVQLMIRDGELHYLVYMRSSDAVFGYKGDYAWHQWVRDNAMEVLNGKHDMGVKPGKIVWNAASFHIYPRHVNLVTSWADEQWEKGEL